MLRIFLSFLIIINQFVVVAQNILDSNSIAIKKYAAIRSAKAYLGNRFSNQDISKQFIADSSSSLFVCDDDRTFFNSNPFCSPVGYEISFDVRLNNGASWDTLYSHLSLPLDSSFLVLEDSLENVWRHGFFEAWQWIITNKYKVNYPDALLFVKQKALQNYSIDFWFEMHNSNYKFYWFLTDIDRAILYRINPKTGAVKVKKLKEQIILPDVD